MRDYNNKKGQERVMKQEKPDREELESLADDNYREYVRQRLLEMAPVIEKVSLGEFDQKIQIPEDKQDEFTELLVGLNLMIEDLRFMFKENNEKTQELERRLTELSVFNEISRALGSTLQLDELLKVIYNQITRIMGGDTFYLALYDEDKNVLEFPLYIVEGATTHMPSRPFGNGLTEYIIQLREPVQFGEDMLEVERKLGIESVRHGEDDYPQSWLGVPMISHDKVIGVISIQSKRPGTYDEDHKRFLVSIANQAASAVANARAYGELERRIGELSAFNEVGRALGSTLKLEEHLKIIYEQASRVMPADHFYVALYHPEDDEGGADIEFVFDVQDAKMIPAHTRPFGNGLTEYIIRSKEPLLIQRNLRERITELGLDVLVRGSPAKSWLGVPLIVRNTVIGVMAAQSVDKEEAYDKGHQAFLVSLASQASGAIDNARAYRELENGLTELSVLNEISRTVNATLDIEELYHVVHEQIRRLFRADNFYIALYNTQADEISFPYVLEDGKQVKSNEGEWAPRRAGHGMTEYVIRSAKPQLVQGDSQVELAKKGVNHIGKSSNSWIGAPMIARNEVVGVMAAQSFSSDLRYNRKHTRLLQLVANQVAPAVENARAYLELEHRFTEISVINEIARAIGSTLDVEELYRVIHEQLKRLVNAENFYIALYDSHRDEVTFPYAFQDGELQKWTSRRAGTGMTEHVIRAGKPQLFKEDSEKEASERGVDHIGKPSSSWLGVPMIIRSQVIGVMTIQSFDPRITYSEKHVSLMQMVANQSAQAIENARAYAVLEQRVAERTAALQKSNESLEDFVYTVSHDLKAPLRAILGFSQFLEEDFGSSLPDEGKMYVGRMSQSAKRMEHLIDDLLEFSRVGRIKDPYEETDTDELLNEILSSIAPGKNVSIRIEGPMPRIICERVRIGQVFSNLVTNAIKYNDKEKPEIVIGFEERDDEVEFFVADNGPGIEERHFEKIFKIFQRLSSDEGGTGIGLALVKKIVEDHQGKVWVESTVGQGTTFRFIIPKRLNQDERE